MPITAANQQDFNRRVVNAFKGSVGGVLHVGRLAFYPIEAAVANHLLCDGTTITRAAFPELVRFLGGVDATQATLPDYTGALTVSAPTAPQTVSESGTIDAGATVTSGEVGGTVGGNVPSGGRVQRPNEAER